MTRQTFLRNLSKIRKRLRWNKGSIVIRAYSGDRVFCPITALYYCREKSYVYNSSFIEVGMRMGLSKKECIAIARASDGCCPNSRLTKAIKRRLGL